MKQMTEKWGLFLLAIIIVLGLVVVCPVTAKAADAYEDFAGIKIYRDGECLNPDEYLSQEWDDSIGPVLRAGDELQFKVYTSNYEKIVTPEACGLTVIWKDDSGNQLGTGSTYTVKAEDVNGIGLWMSDGSGEPIIRRGYSLQW